MQIGRRRYDLAVLAAGLAYPLGFSPFYLWPVSVLSVGLLFWLSSERIVWRYFLFAFGAYLLGTSWIYVSIHEHGNASAPLAALLVFLFVLGISIPWAVFGWIHSRLTRGTVLVTGAIVFASLWMVREWAYTWLFGGFPWLLLGYSQVGLGWIAPFSGTVPVIGVLATGFLMVGAVTLAVAAWRLSGRVRKWLAGCAVAIVVIALACLPVTWTHEVGEPVRVSLVQGNIAQSTKWHPDSRRPILNTYLGLTETEWGRDIVVWPEAALTFFRDTATSLLEQISQHAQAKGTSLILGLPDVNDEGRYVNAAIALGDGRGEYFKKRLVAFGEYVPFEDQLRGLITFFDLPMSRNVPGPARQRPLQAGELTLSMSICYEVVFPELVRNQTSSPDLLVTISNDTWFGASLGPAQHMQMAQARAMENGRYLLRATNNGITGVVAPDGRLVASLPRFEAGVLRYEVYAVSGETPYRGIGDLPWVFVAVLLLATPVVLRKSYQNS